MELDELDLNAVEAALALLEGDQQEVSPSELLWEHSSLSEVSVGKAETLQHVNRKKRVRDPAIDARRRERRRVERQKLKRKADNYEKQLLWLLNEDTEEITVSRATWEQRALNQQRRRDASEQLNNQLRMQLAAHFRFATQLQRLLEKVQGNSMEEEHPATCLLQRSCTFVAIVGKHFGCCKPDSCAVSVYGEPNAASSGVVAGGKIDDELDSRLLHDDPRHGRSS